MNYVVSIALITVGFTVLDQRRGAWHFVAGIIFIAAGFLFLT